MKVSIVVGGKFHAFNLAKYLQDHGYLNEIITSYPKFEVVKYGIDKDKIKTFILKEIINRVYHFFFKKNPPQILIKNTFGKWASYRFNSNSDVYIIWSSYALRTIKRIRKKNPKAIIILERSSAHISKQDALLRSIDEKFHLEKSIISKEILEYELTDYIMLISQFSKRTFLEYNYPEHKILLNNLGVDLTEFPYIEREFSDEEFVVGYAGVISARKNVAELIQSVENLISEGRKIRLMLIGEIENESFNPAIIRTKKFIEYHKSVPQRELKNFYKDIHLFVLNSIEDGFGMVILQAMSTGIPVIATTNTGGPDVIQDGKNGFIVPIQDVNALSDKIQFFNSNRNQCKFMGLEARKKVVSNYSWESYGNRYVDIINSLISKR